MRYGKRVWATGSAAAATVVLLAACGSDSGDGGGEAVELRFAQPAEANHPWQRCGAEPFAEAVSEASDGDIEIRTYSGGQLGAEVDLLNQTIDGSLDMSLINAGLLAERHEAVGVVGAAYLYDDIDSMLEVSRGEIGQELWDELREAAGVEVLDTWALGIRQLTTADVAATSPDDLAGVKIRASDSALAIAYVESLGATPTPMALGEVYLGLQQGVIDGQENPVGIIDTQGFDEVQNYLIMTNHVIQGNQLLFNSARWDSLSEDQQQIITDAAREAGDEVKECVETEQQELLDTWRQNGELEIVEDIDIDAFRARAEQVMLEEFGDQWGDLYERIRSSQAS